MFRDTGVEVLKKFSVELSIELSNNIRFDPFSGTKLYERTPCLARYSAVVGS